MKRDKYGLWVESEGSGGDTPHYSGLAALAFLDCHVPLEMLVNDEGYAVRHFDDGISWHANRNNFTRDQLMPLVAGLIFQGNWEICRKLFWTHFRRAFFCQNIDRDYPNTPKRPYPHWFVNKRGEREFSWFNYRDPLLPHHVLALFVAARFGGNLREDICVALVYGILGPIALVTFILEALSLRWSSNYDIGAFFSTAHILEWVGLFAWLIPDYDKRFLDYFSGWRNFKECAEALNVRVEELR